MDQRSSAPVQINGHSIGTGHHVRDEDSIAELDEPPEPPLSFGQMPRIQLDKGYHDSFLLLDSSRPKQSSLLTQALLTSPEISAASDIELPQLTSDGGLTSPTRTTTPSPPTSRKSYSGFSSIISRQQQSKEQPLKSEQMEEAKVEENLGRKRCISFACNTKGNSQPDGTRMHTTTYSQPASDGRPDVARRPSALRFTCGIKPTRSEPPDSLQNMLSPRTSDRPPKQTDLRTIHDDDQMTHLSGSVQSSSNTQNCVSTPSSAPFDTKDTCKGLANTIKSSKWSELQKREATRANEFASLGPIEDDWTQGQSAYTKRMTIDDTLQKENALRKLIAMDEDDPDDDDHVMQALEAVELSDDDDEEADDVITSISMDHPGAKWKSHRVTRRKFRSPATTSLDNFDDGNESDDEEGFADSDDESEDWSSYQFWTPGITTAATSTDHLDHITMGLNRANSDMSMPSSRSFVAAHDTADQSASNQGSSNGLLHPPSTGPKRDDFIIGTLDEDRPLEEAYMSSLEQRKNNHKMLVPQDIDPSFPTSDPDEDGDECIDSDDEEDTAGESSQYRRRSPHPPTPRGTYHQAKIKSPAVLVEREQTVAKSGTSPRRCRSPPPPRRLFGQTTHRLRSPPPHHQRLTSPPSSRRPSPRNGSPVCEQSSMGVTMAHLAQRPGLTHTASLPRTPNPYWEQHRSRNHKMAMRSLAMEPEGESTRGPGDIRGVEVRGPISIVQGLESKRQRRKEKFWRLHCQRTHAGKEKERKCQPGKGAQRMREVGMEMQDRFKGYGRRGQVVLSI